MSSHYYLIAQLPTLIFGKESPITKDAFLAEAEKWLTEHEMKTLHAVDINRYAARSNDHPVYKNILHYEHLIRTDVAKWREAKKNDLDYKPSTIPAALLKEGTPLDAEMKLMRLRWDYIDEMMRDLHFDFGYLILYYLQLQLLQRFFTFDKERGLEKFQKLYEVNE
jgi:hypothetical protein